MLKRKIWLVLIIVIGLFLTINLSSIKQVEARYDPFENCSETSVETALGCIPIKIEEFTPWLLNILFGIAGGIAFLLMVYGFILIATSSGDEKKVAGAKETISSALIGLLVCIFSIFILRLITVDILQIPGIN
jgi:type IV secretion system pilin